MGLYISHNPQLVERKSGIPDGVEIPAPVRATVNAEVHRNSEACTISDFTFSDVTDGLDLEWMARMMRCDPPFCGFDH